MKSLRPKAGFEREEKSRHCQDRWQTAYKRDSTSKGGSGLCARYAPARLYAYQPVRPPIRQCIAAAVAAVVVVIIVRYATSSSFAKSHQSKAPTAFDPHAEFSNHRIRQGLLVHASLAVEVRSSQIGLNGCGLEAAPLDAATEKWS